MAKYVGTDDLLFGVMLSGHTAAAEGGEISVTPTVTTVPILDSWIEYRKFGSPSQTSNPERSR